MSDVIHVNFKTGSVIKRENGKQIELPVEDSPAEKRRKEYNEFVIATLTDYLRGESEECGTDLTQIQVSLHDEDGDCCGFLFFDQEEPSKEHLSRLRKAHEYIRVRLDDSHSNS